MPNLIVNLYVGDIIPLNGVELLNDSYRFPHPPSNPLVWTLSDHTIGEFRDVSAPPGRTYINVLALKVGVVTVTVTDGLFTYSLDINVIAVPAPVPLGVIIQVLPKFNPNGQLLVLTPPAGGVPAGSGGGGGPPTI